MVFDDSKPYSGILASSSAWLPLLYETIIFVLTLYKTIPALHQGIEARGGTQAVAQENAEEGSSNHSHIIRHLFEDGLLYYR